VAGTDVIRTHRIGQREATQEGALDALKALETGLLWLAFFEVALAPDRQHAVIGGDLDVLGLDPRKVGTHSELGGLFKDVHGRGPVGNSCAVIGGRSDGFAEELIDLAVQPVDRSGPGLIANKGHVRSPPNLDGLACRCAPQALIGPACTKQRLHLMCGRRAGFQGSPCG
jgi:hypothetical protein